MLNAIYSVKAIRDLERAAIKRFDLSGPVLMQRAGEAAFLTFNTFYPASKRVAVVCGGGNNGGDGYVFAHLAHLADLSVQVYLTEKPASLTGEAKSAFDACKEDGVPMMLFEGEIDECDVIVDALLGIGFQGEIREGAERVINTINQANKLVMALDVPSGVNADTGFVPGVAVKADVTLTFIGIKQGLLTGAALDYVGELVCHTLDIPTEAFNQTPVSVHPIATKELMKRLPVRNRNAHKGDFGHVLVLGGNKGYSGAARMAAEAAASVGAGLVTVATHPSHAATLNIGRPELMVQGVADANALKSLIEKASVIIVGPGLGQDAWAHDLLHLALTADCPIVVDADGLNILSEKPQHQLKWVLTPHPGEAARLLGSETASIERNRFEAVTQLQKRYGGACVLKGAGSLIHDGKFMHLCRAGNPGMSSAGMGDVLAGVIGGLLAQKLAPMAAAQLGVELHAEAGDLASEYGERGMLATDLFPFLHQLVNEV